MAYGAPLESSHHILRQEQRDINTINLSLSFSQVGFYFDESLYGLEF